MPLYFKVFDRNKCLSIFFFVHFVLLTPSHNILGKHVSAGGLGISVYSSETKCKRKPPHDVEPNALQNGRYYFSSVYCIIKIAKYGRYYFSSVYCIIKIAKYVVS